MDVDADLQRLAMDCRAYTSDSHAARPGDLFVALRGSTRDGHEFVPALLAAGVSCVVQRGAAVRLGLDPTLGSGRVLEVDDTRAAHRALAALFRRRFRAPVVGIGGSSGKTTAKEFTASLLAARFRVAKTERSQNGELGIPKTLEKLRDGIDVAVVEIGIDAPGDMLRHAAVVAPDLAVLTSIGEEHLNRLGSLEGVFREEILLFGAARARGGACFCPVDDPWLARLAAVPGVHLVPSDPRELHPALDTPLRNPYARRNAALACAVAFKLGMQPEEIAPALLTLSLPEGRGAEHRLETGVVLLLDHYNANPSSMRAGLAAAHARAEEEKLPLRLVLGDMFDLGVRCRRAHEGLVGDLKRLGAQSLWLVGPEMSRLGTALSDAVPEVRTFANSAAAASAAEGLRGPPAVVLFKGSRGMGLECVIEALIGA
jgi:UDP-N-acetylmuramoyl-tripeptide--D-alanyl-D-alanine ligase